MSVQRHKITITLLFWENSFLAVTPCHSSAQAFLHGSEVTSKNRAQIKARASVFKVQYTSTEIVPSDTYPAYLTSICKAHFFVCFEVLTVVLLKIRLLDLTDKAITIFRNGCTTASHSLRRSVCQEYGPTNPSQLISLH